MIRRRNHKVELIIHCSQSSSLDDYLGNDPMMYLLEPKCKYTLPKRKSSIRHWKWLRWITAPPHTIYNTQHIPTYTQRWVAWGLRKGSLWYGKNILWGRVDLMSQVKFGLFRGQVSPSTMGCIWAHFPSPTIWTLVVVVELCVVLNLNDAVSP